MYKSRILILLVALFVSIYVNATSNGICGDGLTFRIENGTLTISKTAEGTGSGYFLRNGPFEGKNSIFIKLIGGKQKWD